MSSIPHRDVITEDKFLKKMDKKEKPPSSELSPTIRLYLIVFAASIGIFIGGTYIGWTSPVTRMLRNPNNKFGAPLTDEELSWMVSLVDLGTIFSSYLCYYLMDHWGRRVVIILIAPLGIITWATVYFSKTLTLIFFARFLQGIHNGMTYLIIPVYACEMAPARLRGVACTIMSGMYAAGIMYSYIVGSLVSFQTLNLMCLLIAVGYLCAIFYTFETPYYYLMMGKEKEARAVTELFDKRFTEAGFQHMRDCVQEEMKKDTFKDVITNKDHPFLVIILLSLAFKFTYFWNTPAYAVFIFSRGNRHFTADQYSIFLAFILLISMLLTAVLVRKIGRRRSAMLAESLTAVIAYSICYFFYLQEVKKMSTVGYEWILLILLSLLVFFAHIGLAPMPIVQQVEFFPSRARALAGAMVISVSSMSGWIADMMYEMVASSYGLYWNYCISGSVAVFMWLFTWLLLPDTKGKSMHDIQLEIANPPLGL